MFETFDHLLFYDYLIFKQSRKTHEFMITGLTTTTVQQTKMAVYHRLSLSIVGIKS